MSARILVIEDDGDIAAVICSSLTASGFETERCFDAREGLQMALSGHFDAITVDQILRGCDGLEIVKAVRESGLDTPILMLSALADLGHRLAGVRGGGDDYVIKPFEPEELVFRIEVLLRRNARNRQALQLKVRDLELDLLARRARRGARSIELLPMEFKLLEFLMRNSGQMLSRRIIFEHVWGRYFDPETNLIDVHIGRLRRKIDEPGSPSFIRTKRGVGFVVDAI
jgi:two-component system OmpR family response regulator